MRATLAEFAIGAHALFDDRDRAYGLGTFRVEGVVHVISTWRTFGAAGELAGFIALCGLPTDENFRTLDRPVTCIQCLAAWTSGRGPGAEPA